MQGQVRILKILNPANLILHPKTTGKKGKQPSTLALKRTRVQDMSSRADSKTRQTGMSLMRARSHSTWRF
jgi:hypothetical protein